MSHASPSPADLLAHVSWVRALARELVRDGTEAEDLAQEALVRVLEHPPRSDAALGGFLRRLLFNLRSERHRKDARRANASRHAPRPRPRPTRSPQDSRASVSWSRLSSASSRSCAR